MRPERQQRQQPDMPPTTLYHNPRCSKSRGALELLRERGIEPDVVHYLEHAPTAADLRALLQMLGLPARALLRQGEPEHASLGLAEVADDETLIAAMAEHPVLIERPIVVHGGRAVIGRPPERVLELFRDE
jgi:arsenate reductase